MAEQKRDKKTEQSGARGGIGGWLKDSFSIQPAQVATVIKNGLLFENPVLVLLLGMCSTLAITTSMENAIGMGVATTAVLIMSNFFISLLRNVIPQKVRIASYVVIIAGFVTIIDLLMQAYFPALSTSLGIFVPLIVVNCIILARAEAFASKNTPIYSILDGLFMGLGFTLALSIMSVIRELLGKGTLFGITIFGENYPGIGIMTSTPGGFLTLGCVIAVVQFIRGRADEKKKAEEKRRIQELKEKKAAEMARAKENQKGGKNT